MDEEWYRWRLIMSADCAMTRKEVFELDDFELSVANAALDKVIKMNKEANKKPGKGKKRGGRR